MRTTQNKPLILSHSEIIRSFIKDVGLPFNKAPEALGLKSSDFLNWWSGNNPQLVQSNHLSTLSQFLRIDEDDIVERTYNKDLVRSVFFTGSAVLPEKYSQNQFSYLRSSAHIIKFLTLSRGQHFSDMIMQKMNIGPLIYANLDNKISLNYFIDLLELLAEHGLKQDELDSLACVLFLSLGDTPLGQKFKKAKTYYESYEVLAQNIHLFDSNFTYNFELDRKHIQLQAVLYFDNHPHIDWSRTNINRLLRYRRFLIGWFPYMANLAPIFPHYTSSFHKDRVEATYTLKFKDKNTTTPLFCVPKDS